MSSKQKLMIIGISPMIIGYIVNIMVIVFYFGLKKGKKYSL